ncbi:MAG: VWA domain-containing protein [Alphaproteobacteria bacterium]|nr:VWA domain-containing protein [Alphaproteobacteria bacterium]
MSVEALPQAVRPFVQFTTLLRTHGFAVAPEQTQSFLNAISLLGPKSMQDIRRGAHATLAPPFERREEFDALFSTFFEGQIIAAPAQADGEDDEIRAQEDQAGTFEPLVSEDENEVGEQASHTEALTRRTFEPLTDSQALARFNRLAPQSLPRRKVRRRKRSSQGDRFDVRRTLREAVRTEGDVMKLPKLARKTRHRPVLLLIDVSGSMKEHTDSYLRFAHALSRAVERIEVFTIGTRLTRITRPLAHRNAEQALIAAGQTVSDWDGGTRLGDALQAFLAIPRFAGFARGALVLVLSDGLERGDHMAMTDAVNRLARRAWQVHWLSPLAADARFVPETAALKSILPVLDGLAGAGSVESVCDCVLSLAKRRAA